MAPEVEANSNDVVMNTFPMEGAPESSPENTNSNDNIVIEQEETLTESEESSSAEPSNKSALQDNLARKGKNAYYFAHAHKANGPKWDGKAEPKLLSSRSLSNVEQQAQISARPSSFDFQKSNITAYSFCDGKKNVKLYIDLKNVGEICREADVSLDFTESSFCLVIQNYNKDKFEKNNEPLCLSFRKLTANITNASYKKKPDRIILTLTKEQEKEWHSVNDKGSP